MSMLLSNYKEHLNPISKCYQFNLNYCQNQFRDTFISSIYYSCAITEWLDSLCPRISSSFDHELVPVAWLAIKVWGSIGI